MEVNEITTFVPIPGWRYWGTKFARTGSAMCPGLGVVLYGSRKETDGTSVVPVRQRVAWFWLEGTLSDPRPHLLLVGSDGQTYCAWVNRDGDGDDTLYDLKLDDRKPPLGIPTFGFDPPNTEMNYLGPDWSGVVTAYQLKVPLLLEEELGGRPACMLTVTGLRHDTGSNNLVVLTTMSGVRITAKHKPVDFNRGYFTFGELSGAS